MPSVLFIERTRRQVHEGAATWGRVLDSFVFLNIRRPSLEGKSRASRLRSWRKYCTRRAIRTSIAAYPSPKSNNATT